MHIVDLRSDTLTKPTADMRRAMADILGAFRPGRNAFLSRLLMGRRVERILFAATKADHLNRHNHDRLAAILEKVVERARARASWKRSRRRPSARARLFRRRPPAAPARSRRWPPCRSPTATSR